MSSLLDVNCPLPGDIVLTASRGAVRCLNMRSQGLVGIQYSHAMLVVSHESVVHALVDSGSIESSLWAMTGHESVFRWMVIRNDLVAEKILAIGDLNSQPSFEARLQRAARAKIGLKYNKLFYVARLLGLNYILRNADALFCSQLIAVIFDELKLPLSRREHDRVFPRQLKNLVVDAGWRDVTGRYWDWYNGNVKAALGFDAPELVDPKTFRAI